VKGGRKVAEMKNAEFLARIPSSMISKSSRCWNWSSDPTPYFHGMYVPLNAKGIIEVGKKVSRW